MHSDSVHWKVRKRTSQRRQGTPDASTHSTLLSISPPSAGSRFISQFAETGSDQFTIKGCG